MVFLCRNELVKFAPSFFSTFHSLQSGHDFSLCTNAVTQEKELNQKKKKTQQKKAEKRNESRKKRTGKKKVKAKNGRKLRNETFATPFATDYKLFRKTALPPPAPTYSIVHF